MKTKFQIFFILACAMAVQAGPRSSASGDYIIATDTADSGGSRSTSVAYTHDGSLGGVTGISTVPTPAETAKHGYLGQLYEVTGLTVTATPASVNEEATRQLVAQQVLDDDSHLSVNAGSVGWSVVTGPVSGISSAGLATAGMVYQNTSATVQGVYGGFTGPLVLTVLNTLPDNYGSYGGDGLDDSWQNQYFGLDNPLAGPGADPDGDSQNNQFEFTAGLIPTDPLSRFLLRIEPVAGQPAQKRLIFSPRLADRTYNILTNATLNPDTWSALTGGIVSDNLTERTVTDTSASGNRKFYRVQVVKP